ncbi:Rid family hydrolase [Conexibacter woesei]|uniref:Endoribonuclease L-PSP n=1 Tax=Conexibacter woesei (strain DSM 14684 / CCUG 47730 / CIP 108061 / JCM 11494 / NBRC 100937 / ID131577) TaxID=469383 RepID=D3FBJ9_CONWI|nr:Rid family hydrolase [Conexibacter woesei]ADB49368.1 Endoribonuclease L-PSP [Conexibacter woesei DSM 14684]
MHTVRSGSPFEQLASYSRAARIGDIVAVSGTAALDETGVSLFPGDPAAQTREALMRALEAAAALGARREDVVRTRIYLLAGTEWRGAVEAHGAIFRGVDPANTTLHVAELIPQDCLVEVELDAVASGPVSERASS